MIALIAAQICFFSCKVKSYFWAGLGHGSAGNSAHLFCAACLYRFAVLFSSLKVKQEKKNLYSA